MFEEFAEVAVAAALVFDIVMTVVLASLAIKWHRKYQFVKAENSVLIKKAKILETGNDLLKQTVDDLKQRNIESNVKRAELVKRNRELSDKLESSHKKLSIFSKMLNDMKNS